ncbi:transposase [Chroococcus sp. FPU101]|uniref:transposase n=1 Tax=Chroococcus sp. FPU101 TaxID=1974212 RepID=UPI001A8EF039|nr:transposase [Chroococcus sp. FPU101]GFE69716.1 hypothetical protein CFPU101_23260 [Chroococcus sp. FPU101]
MTGIPKIEIVETAEELRDLMKRQKSELGYAKVQALYLLKIEVDEFSDLNTQCFALFLELFSWNYSEEIQILQLNNASSHTTKNLVVPDNIILLFQPPYTPEVNPIERLWEHLKSFLKWRNFENLDKLRDAVSQILAKFNKDIIQSLIGWDFILNALSLSGI